MINLIIDTDEIIASCHVNSLNYCEHFQLSNLLYQTILMMYNLHSLLQNHHNSILHLFLLSLNIHSGFILDI